eukprot:GILK01002181.1.p1 GENE.GILK01002181.1~~GILK01002181.1.p1  ORF type:complete len:916 (-),score=199.27 GILK01002181.1:158-2905(-)
MSQLSADQQRQVQAVLDSIKQKVFSKRIRLEEFFRDFDPLHTGCVTKSQFERVLGMSDLSRNIAPENVQLLCLYYQNEAKKDLVRHVNFINDVDSVFTVKELEKAPTKPVHAPGEGIQTLFSRRPFTPRSQSKLDELLDKLRAAAHSRGLIIKYCYQDFDRRNLGTVSQSQFRRALPFQLSAEEVDLLVARYTDDRNDINYRAFHEDVVPSDVSTPNSVQANSSSIMLSPTRGGFMSTQENLDADALEKRLQAAIVERRIRIEEFFKDFDKLRKYTCTEGQFRTVMAMANLRNTEEELKAIFRRYRNENGLFAYKDFCENINTAFTVKGLEKAPEHIVSLPDANTTLPARRQYNTLSAEDEQMLEAALEAVVGHTRQRRLILTQSFQDFDRTHSQHVSADQFRRVLSLAHFPLSEAEMQSLVKRFADKGNQRDVNYVEFCQLIDSLTRTAPVTVPESIAPLSPAKNVNNYKTQLIERYNTLTAEDVLATVRAAVMTNRIRIGEFFRDFDKLRSGLVTAEKFKTGLTMSNLRLTVPEVQVLVDRYGNGHGQVRWREFVDAVEEVTVRKGLEKDPTMEPAVPFVKTQYGRAIRTDSDAAVARAVVNRFAEETIRRRLDVKPFFQDFDKHKNGRVTFRQFRQVLSSAAFDMTDEEFNAVSREYASEQANLICYAKFLDDGRVEQAFTSPTNGSATVDGISNGLQATVLSPANNRRGEVDIQRVLDHIQEVVFKRRIRVPDFFRDYDVLRKGFVPKAKFRTALSMMNFTLTNEEMDALETYYEHPKTAEIYYVPFAELAESVFTRKGLEKDPSATVATFQPSSNRECVLSERDEEALNNLMNRLSSSVRMNGVLTKPYFKDKDRNNSGCVTRSQFHSALSFLNLMLSEQEVTLLQKRFGRGPRDVSYLEFCQALESGTA